MSQYISEYAQFLKAGPFPGRIDPWVEISYFFKQFHRFMIGKLFDQIQDPLLERDMIALQVPSLQSTEWRESDYFMHDVPSESRTMSSIHRYEEAAEALGIEPGDEAADKWPITAVVVRQMKPKRNITHIEFVTPVGKSHNALRYRDYRALLLSKGVNFVEIDLTRSPQRLLESKLTQEFPYHIAIYLPGDFPRLITWNIESPPKRFALPLIDEVIPVDLGEIYQSAYYSSGIAAQIEFQQRYHADEIPYPLTLTNHQRQQILEQVIEWLNRLNDLRRARQNGTQE